MANRKSYFHVENLNLVPMLLRQLGDEFAPKVLRQAFLDAAIIVRDEAARRAPVKSGRLSEMMGRTSGIDKKSGQVFVKVGGIRLSKKRIERSLRKKSEGKTQGIVITGGPYYDRFVEYGTRFQKAQPYLRPAFDAKKEEFVLQIRDTMGDRVDKFLRKRKNTSTRGK